MNPQEKCWNKVQVQVGKQKAKLWFLMVFPSGAERGPRDGDHRWSVDVKGKSCLVLGKLNSSHQTGGLVASQLVS